MNKPLVTTKARALEHAKVPKASQMINPNGVLSHPVLVCLLILTTLAVLGALYVGKDVILPIVLALVLKLLLQPLVDLLCGKLRIPQPVGALVMIAAVFGSIAAVGFTVSGPATGWIQRPIAITT